MIYRKCTIQFDHAAHPFDKTAFPTDFQEKIGNVLLRPSRLIWGHRFHVCDNVFTELPSLSKVKKVFAGIVFIVLIPISGTITLIGWTVTAFSKTHANAYRSYVKYCKAVENDILQNSKSPAATEKNKLDQLLTQYYKAKSQSDKTTAQAELAKGLNAVPQKDLSTTIDEWFKGFMFASDKYVKLLVMHETTPLPSLVVQKAEKELRAHVAKSKTQTIPLSDCEFNVYCRVCGDSISELLKNPSLMKGNEVKLLQAIFKPKRLEENPLLIHNALECILNLPAATENRNALKEILEKWSGSLDFSKLPYISLKPLADVFDECKADLSPASAATFTTDVVEKFWKTKPFLPGSSISFIFNVVDAAELHPDDTKKELLFAAAYNHLSLTEFQTYIDDMKENYVYYIVKGSRDLTQAKACARLQQTLITTLKIHQVKPKKAFAIVNSLFEMATPEQSLLMIRLIAKHTKLHFLGDEAMTTLCDNPAQLQSIAKNLSDQELKTIYNKIVSTAQTQSKFENEVQKQGRAAALI